MYHIIHDINTIFLTCLILEFFVTFSLSSRFLELLNHFFLNSGCVAQVKHLEAIKIQFLKFRIIYGSFLSFLEIYKIVYIGSTYLIHTIFQLNNIGTI